jgi:hypothetical protein
MKREDTHKLGNRPPLPGYKDIGVQHLDRSFVPNPSQVRHYTFKCRIYHQRTVKSEPNRNGRQRCAKAKVASRSWTPDAMTLAVQACAGRMYIGEPALLISKHFFDDASVISQSPKTHCLRKTARNGPGRSNYSWKSVSLPHHAMSAFVIRQLGMGRTWPDESVSNTSSCRNQTQTSLANPCARNASQSITRYCGKSSAAHISGDSDEFSGPRVTIAGPATTSPRRDAPLLEQD